MQDQVKQKHTVVAPKALSTSRSRESAEKGPTLQYRYYLALVLAIYVYVRPYLILSWQTCPRVVIDAKPPCKLTDVTQPRLRAEFGRTIT